MLKVGVTGGIGSGKSIVCKIFEILHVPVFYADLEARRIMQEDPELRTDLVDRFGDETWVEGKLNRDHLARRIFSNPDDRAYVNGLVHPKVQLAFVHWSLAQREQAYVIEEAALVFESDAHRLLDYIILVEAPVETRIKRVMERDSVSRRSVEVRLKAQADPDTYVSRADFRIRNGGKEFVVPQVLEADKILRTIAK